MPFDEHFLLSVLERSPLATAIYDSADLNIAFANQAMLDTWSATSSILGHTLCACFPSFEKEGFSSILKNVEDRDYLSCQGYSGRYCIREKYYETVL